MRVNKAEITKMPCKIRYASQKRTKERREREKKINRCAELLSNKNNPKNSHIAF